MLRDVSVGEDVNPTPDTVEDAALVEAGERLPGNPERLEVLRTEHAPSPSEGEEVIGVCHEA